MITKYLAGVAYNQYRIGLGPRGIFSLTNESWFMMWRRTWENLWLHMLHVGTLNALIQSEAIMRKARVRFWLRNLKTASDWIDGFKGPNVCNQRFSRAHSCLWHSKLSSKKTLGTRGVQIFWGGEFSLGTQWEELVFTAYVVRIHFPVKYHE